ncbi:MAG: hypothetical protein AB7V56_17420 [Candidatus Nitrosocosmicus sp.]
MNIIENEIPYLVEAKISRSLNNGKSDDRISYQFLDPIYGLCLDTSEVLTSQIQACKRFLKNVKVNSEDDMALRREIMRLKLALDMVAYREIF